MIRYIFDRRRAYLRSVFPIFLFPANRCFGFFSWMCRSDSPALPDRLVVFACIFFSIFFNFLRVSGSRMPDWSRGAREVLRLRPPASESTSIFDLLAALWDNLKMNRRINSARIYNKSLAALWQCPLWS